MAGLLFPNFASAIGGGMALRQQQQQADKMEEDRAAKAEIAPLIPKALAGDKDALDQIGARHPDSFIKMLPMLQHADAAKRAKLKEDTDYAARAGLSLLNAPPDQQPALYAQTRAQRAAQGGDVSNWPAEYNPSWVKMQVNQALTVAQQLDRLNEGPQAMPPPGGGASMPAGPGGSVIDRASAASKSLESGGRYDAVGPVVNSKGNRAYGAHQVMDFNIGPWTQEVLGQAMTPQQFLASPQAQDAVYKAKMGQYIQKYGSPEAGARAWFAGEGGMNNPNAKDVLGTTVQAYGDRFAQAYGAGATGPGPQIAQGDNTRADASGNPLPPPATAPGALDGTDINGLRKQLIASGGDLFIDPKTKQIEMQNGHYVVRSTQNPRQIIQLIPAPKPKEPGADKGKPLDNSARDELTKASGGVLELTELVKSFDPSFGGFMYGPLGDADNARKRNLPDMLGGKDEKGQAQWWQRYQQFANLERNKLFGAALTPGEAAEFNKAMINPGMKPDEIAANLSRQRDVATKALSRIVNSMVASGYNAQAIEAATGIPVAELPSAMGGVPQATRPAPAAGPVPAPAQQPAPQMPRAGADRGRVLFEARDAIAKGADPAKVRERLRAMGVEDEP